MKKTYRLLIATSWDCCYLAAFDEKTGFFKTTEFIEDALAYETRQEAFEVKSRIDPLLCRSVHCCVEDLLSC